MTTYEATTRPQITNDCNTTVNGVNPVKINLRNAVFATDDNLEACAGFVNAILKFLSGDEVAMPIPSNQGDSFSAFADITRERSACVLTGLNRIAETIGLLDNLKEK